MNNPYLDGNLPCYNQEVNKLLPLIKFELKSVIGRVLCNKKIKKKADCKLYLHLGAGNNYIDGFVNADFYRFRYAAGCGNKLDWEIDLRYKLNCDDNVFSGIFSEHTLEHLNWAQASHLLKECHRILKKDSVIRLVVPDLEKYINYYTKVNNCKEFSTRFPLGALAIRNMTQNYLHLSCWDYELLSCELLKAGFVNIRKCNFREGLNSFLLCDLDSRSWESLYVEARK